MVSVPSADWIKKVGLRLGITGTGREEREPQVPGVTASCNLSC